MNTPRPFDLKPLATPMSDRIIQPRVRTRVKPALRRVPGTLRSNSHERTSEWTTPTTIHKLSFIIIYYV